MKKKMEGRNRARLHESSFHCRKNRKNSVRKKGTGQLFTNECNDIFDFGQISLEIVLFQGQHPEKEDHLSSNKYPSRLPKQYRGKKNRETCDLLDFLLNHYYHIPKYSSICLEPSHPKSTCRWQRSVYATGNGFQIKLRKYQCDSTRWSQMQNLHTRDPVQKPQNRAKLYYAKGCSKEFKYHLKYTASEADDQLTPTDRKGHLLKETHAYQVEESGSQNHFSSPKRSAELKLADFLEVISSDSECFNETLIRNKEEEEKYVAIYENAPERGSNNQEISLSQLTLYSKYKHFGEEKYSEYQFRKPVKRFKYEPISSWLEGENNFMRVENSNSKLKKRLGPKYMLDQGNYHKSSSGYVRGNTRKKRRRSRKNKLHQRANYRSFHVSTSSEFTNTFYSRRFRQRRQNTWKTRYNQNIRRLTRHENSTYFRPTSDNYIRCNNQKHTSYRSYSQNNYNKS